MSNVAFLLMNSLSDGSWNADTLQLRDVVTLLILNCVTLLPRILSCFAVFSELKSTLLARNGLLDRPLGDLTFSFLNISTNSVWDYQNPSARKRGKGTRWPLSPLL